MKDEEDPPWSLATEAAAMGGISTQAFTPTEEWISAFIYPGASCAGHRVQPARVWALSDPIGYSER